MIPVMFMLEKDLDPMPSLKVTGKFEILKGT